MNKPNWKPKEKWQPKESLVHADVDNPYFSREHEVSKDNPRKVRVAKNLRESAVETLFARGRLDEAQRKAADRFRATWEACGGAGTGAMDYAQLRVDGGGTKDPISERQVDAGRTLAACRVLLGARNYKLVCQVAGQGLSFGDITQVARDRLTMADNLRDSLDDLAKMWGLSR